jgi:glycerophosphoryl diester phosphodiesterase
MTTVLIHRAGLFPSRKTINGLSAPNTILAAEEMVSDQRVDGCEIDLRRTKDRQLVVTHNSVKHVTLAQLHQSRQEISTLSDWMHWLERHPSTILYLDLKDLPDLDAFIRAIGPIHGKIWMGTKNRAFAQQLLRERKERNLRYYVYLQISHPLFPQKEIRTIIHNFTIPLDGVHFFSTHFMGRIPGYCSILQRFINQAHAHHLKVIAGSTNRTRQMKNLIAMGVDVIMPNRPEQIPSFIKKNK